jgi:hypothetical protein
MMPVRHYCLKCLLRISLALVLLLPGASFAQALEHQVQAAFLFKFLSFVDWPPASFTDPLEPYVIGVMGAEEAFQELIAIVPDRQVQNRPVIARQVRPNDDLSGLHMLFVGRRATDFLPRLNLRPGLLLVTEIAGGLDHGSVINFIRFDDRIRFEVSLEAAERRNLHISSRMLAVAQNVRSGIP